MRWGLLLVVAGCSATGVTPDAGAPTPCTAADTGTWKRLAPLPAARQECAVAALDGELWVVGGFDSGLSFVATVEVYTPATNVWRTAASLPRPLHHVNLAVHQGTLYALGGLEAGFAASPRCYRYTKAADAWVELATMPAGTERGAASVAVDGERIIIAGGYRAGSAVADVSAYLPATDTWVALPPLPIERDHGVGALAGGVFFAIGGRHGSIDGRVDALVQGAWAPKAAMLTPRAGAAAAEVGGRVLVAGGEGNMSDPLGVFAQAEWYDAAADRWEAGPDMRTPRHGCGAAAIDGVIYVPGGASRASFAAVATHEALCP